jgi:hypothetical protein
VYAHPYWVHVRLLAGRGDERFAAVVCGLTKQAQSQSDLSQRQSPSDRLPPYSRAAATTFLEVTAEIRGNGIREINHSSATA